MSTINLSTSYVQDNKHLTKSERFQVIQPAMIGQVLSDHGFELVHLKTAKAKQADKQDFQTTVARYRSRDAFEVEGLSLDLIFKVPHLYGSLVGVLGLFRGVCSNQLNVGRHFETIKVRHSGTPLEDLNQLIPALVAQREKLIETVRIMQTRDVTPSEIIELAKQTAMVRLAGVDNAYNINFQDLITPRRQEDLKSDLFSVMNVIQENLIRYGVRYQTHREVEGQRTLVRNQVARRVNEASVRAIDLNGSVWDLASQLLVG